MGKNIHTVKNSKADTWENKEAGKSRALTNHDTKAEAIKAGRDLARENQAEHIIHNKNGKIGGSNSYGSDPYPPKG